jgi:cobalt-zinc-cadmium efflux system membrane fusion protein
VRRLSAASAASDAQLLARFVGQHDEDAFAVLVRRHGPMVLSVCTRVLTDRHAVEDAFQATFLILVRQAGALRNPELLANWLYGVAYRVACRARASAGRQRAEAIPAEVPSGEDPAVEAARRELRPILDEELNRLPEIYRAALVLCHLEGRTHEEAARCLGCPRETVTTRLVRARERLRIQLARRGLALSASALCWALGREAGAVPATLAASTAQAAFQFAAGQGVLAASSSGIELAKGVLQAMFLSKLKTTVGVLIALAVVSAATVLLAQPRGTGQDDPGPKPTLTPNKTDALTLPPALSARLGVQSTEVRPRVPAQPRTLELPGALAIDPNRLVRIGSRVAGEVKEVAVNVGDRVKKGQVLAVILSQDVGAAKAALIDAIVQVHFDQAKADRIQELHKQGVIAEGALLESQRTLEVARQALARAERTLRTWQMSEEEIKALKEEAERIAKGGKREPEKEAARARTEIRAPIDGTVLEKNVALGELVNASVELFKVADMTRLLVMVQAAENDLPGLEALPADRRRWKIRLPANPDLAPIEGKIEKIGAVVDPNQHTITLSGTVDNAEGKLRAGQFVIASLPLSAEAAEIAIPASALVEQGPSAFIFVQPDPDKPSYELRRVTVVRRGRDVVHVRWRQQPGERVVTAAGVELKALLDDLQAAKKP